MLGILSLYGINFCLQWFGWIPSFIFQTEKIFDVTGTSSHILLTVLSLSQLASRHSRQNVQGALVIIWAFRLFLYLFSRSLYNEDRRFKLLIVNGKRFLFAFTIQGVWVSLNLLPSLICLTNESQPPLTRRDYIGWIMWVIGFLFESIADYQKGSFRSNPANKNKFISHGLWSISRHPNYFGEILLWFGLYLSASSTFSGLQYLSVLCPLIVTLNITLRSGIPTLEKHGKQTWGTNKQYQKYLENTPVLVPYWK